MEILREFLEFELIRVGEYKIRVYTLATILIIFLITKLILVLIKKTLFRKRKINEFDKGNAYALFQIIRYVIWVIAIGLVLETIGIKVTVLIAGSAALLVGLGLGLQQTFNDVISGIILLSEKSIKIDDILEISAGKYKENVIYSRVVFEEDNLRKNYQIIYNKFIENKDSNSLSNCINIKLNKSFPPTSVPNKKYGISSKPNAYLPSSNTL